MSVYECICVCLSFCMYVCKHERVSFLTCAHTPTRAHFLQLIRTEGCMHVCVTDRQTHTDNGLTNKTARHIQRTTFSQPVGLIGKSTYRQNDRHVARMGRRMDERTHIQTNRQACIYTVMYSFIQLRNCNSEISRN